MEVVVVDSVAALVPRAELEGEMGDPHIALQARLMSQVEYGSIQTAEDWEDYEKPNRRGLKWRRGKKDKAREIHKHKGICPNSREERIAKIGQVHCLYYVDLAVASHCIFASVLGHISLSLVVEVSDT